jgi:hypothetical protein
MKKTKLYVTLLADSLLEGSDAAGKVSAKELLGLLQEKHQPGLD